MVKAPSPVVTGIRTIYTSKSTLVVSQSLLLCNNHLRTSLLSPQSSLRAFGAVVVVVVGVVGVVFVVGVVVAVIVVAYRP